jgi:hypothetical protein
MVIKLVRFVKFAWVISVLLFLSVLLYVYAFIPEQIAIDGSNGAVDRFVPKETFFYVALGIFIVANIVFMTLSKLLNEIPVRQGVNLVSLFKSESFKHKIVLWVISFLWILNVFFILTLVFLGLLNHPDGPQATNYTLFLYPGLLLLGFWLFILLFLIFRRK